MAAGFAFYNTSRDDFDALLADAPHLAGNLRNYIAGFSRNMREVLERFDFDNTISKLDEAGLLFQVLERFRTVDLHPDKIDNPTMGAIFEELTRKFNEARLHPGERPAGGVDRVARAALLQHRHRHLRGERAFEDAIEAALLRHGPDEYPDTPRRDVADESPPYVDPEMRPGGYHNRRPEDYDRTLCLLPNDVLDFVLATQPKQWQRLSQHHGTEVRARFLNRL